MRFASPVCVLLVVFLLLCAPVIACAQDVEAPVRPYDGIQAGLDAFRLAEEQRQAAVAAQLNHNETMRAWSGLPSARGTTIYYGYPVAAPVVDLDYAYGRGRFWGGIRMPIGAGPLTVFEPWPFVPGDIYGYRYAAPIRQPIGQWQGQTGPRRWESHPVYETPLPDFRPLPEIEPQLEAPRPALPPAPPPPAASPRRGPREY